MKITAFFIVVFSVQASATTYGQKINLTYQNAPLTNVIKALSKQGNIDFVYKDQYMEKAKPVTIIVRNAMIEKVLSQIFRDQPFIYHLEDGIVYITPNADSVQISLTQTKPETLQKDTLRGQVVDEEGYPIRGASVVLVGTIKGTSTDDNGIYSLEVQDIKKAILEISNIGYKTIRISAKGRTVINVRMENEHEQVEEIIVTGFQNIPIQEVTGAIKVLGSKDLDNRISTDVISRLQGLIPGLQVDKDMNITIRGRSTFYGNQSPLIVIDGFPTEDGLESINPASIENITVLQDASAASIYGTRAANGVIVITTKEAKLNEGLKIDASVFKTIYQRPDINDLQLMNSAEYIDLKLQSLRSRNQDPNYFVNYYIDDPYYPTDAVQEIYIRNLLRGNPNFDQSLAYSDLQMEKALDSLRSIDGYSQINKYLLRNALNDQYNISIQNGGKTNKFYASVVFNDDKEMRIGNSNNRLIAFLKNSLTLNDRIKLDIGANVIYKKSIENSPLEGSGWDILDQEGFMPFNSIIDNNGKRAERPQIGFWEIENKKRQGYLPYVTNPLNELEENDKTSSSLNTRMNLGLNIKLLDGLFLNPKFQYERNFNSIEEYYSVENPRWSRAINTYTLYDESTGDLTYQLPLGGRLDGFESQSSNWTHRTTLSYNKTLAGNNRLTLLTGLETGSISRKGNQYQIIGYDPDVLTTTPYDQLAFLNYDLYSWTGDIVGAFYPMLPSKDENKMTELSYFGNGAYSYQGKYNLSTSFRMDKASIFGLSKTARNNLLWSVGFNWNIKKELFFTPKWINLLKLRLTYGVNGNRPDSRQTSFLTGRVSIRSYGNAVQQVTLTNPANPNLSAEKVGTFNLGLDYEILGNRVYGSLDFYNKSSRNLIGLRSLDPTVGWTQASINYARAKNIGFTASTNVRIVDSHDFEWTATLNFSYNKNIVTRADLSPAKDLDLILPFSNNGLLIEGQPIDRIYAYEWAGLDNKGEPQIIEDGKITSWSEVKYAGFNSKLLHPMGATVPPFYGGFQNTFRYQNLDFGFLFTYKFGNKMRAPVGSKYALYYSPLQIEPKVLADRWRKPGDENMTDVPAFSGYLDFDQYDYYDYYRSSNINVLNASYIRLSNLFLNYNLSGNLIKKTGINNLALKIQAKDLWLWAANNWGVDPDASNNAELNDDIPRFPRYKAFVFGLDIKF